MSGILKKIGKVFNKIVKSKIFKYVAIAAAVYFTAGIALGAAGVGFAAALPGISTAASAIGLGEVGAFGAAAASTAAAAGSAVGLAEAGGALAAEAGAGGVGAASAVGAEMGTAGAALGTAGEAAGGVLATGTAADLAGTAAEGGGFALTSAPTAITGATDAAATSAESGAGAWMNGAAGSAANGAGVTSAPSSNIFGSIGDGAKGVLKFFDNNPTVAKAAMTFGSDALKTGVAAYSQKSQQEATDQRMADARQRQSAPILSNPVDYTKYNKGVVNSVSGVDNSPKGP